MILPKISNGSFVFCGRCLSTV